MINDVTPPGRRLRRKLKQIEPPETPMLLPTVASGDKPETVAFKTPEQAAEADHTSKTGEGKLGAAALAGTTQPSKKPWYRLNWPPSRRQQIIAGVLVVVLLATAGVGWQLTRNQHATTASGTPTKVKKVIPPKIIYSDLSGLPITDAGLNSKPVTAVMVENSLDARPQSGLGDAGVVFEAVAEGGVTRFMALFQDAAPTDVGPIRSARPYYVSWALGFDAAYAHVGGSDAALADITSWHVQDMNQFSNGSSYHRITTRDAPHNVYTGIDTLNKLEAAKGYGSTFTGFPRGKDAPAAAPTTTSIDLSLSGTVYNPHYDYVAGTNSYNRSEDGTSHIDANTGKQLSPKVVIAIVVPLAQGALDASGAYYSDYTTIGSGQAFIFQNGTLTTGTWTKTDNTAQMTFTDANGKTIPLNRGQTWISAVSAANQVHYK